MSDFLQRCVTFFGSLFFVATLTFFLLKMVPGDPFDDEQALPKEMHDSLRKHYGFDQPWIVQYGQYLLSILQGDLGVSLKFKGVTVSSLIQQNFPISAALGLLAISFALFGGILSGIWAACKMHQWQDYLIVIASTLFLSMPSFLIAVLLQYTLAIKLPLFPIARWGTIWHMILPALALAALPMAFITRLVRTTMDETLKSDFILTARAKGLPLRLIFIRHALPHALLPVVSYLGPLLTNVLVGSFIIEKIFSIPGLGQWFINSVNNRDYSIVMGLTLFYSALLIGTVSLANFILQFLDPRLSHGQTR